MNSFKELARQIIVKRTTISNEPPPPVPVVEETPLIKWLRLREEMLNATGIISLFQQIAEVIKKEGIPKDRVDAHVTDWCPSSERHHRVELEKLKDKFEEREVDVAKLEWDNPRKTSNLDETMYIKAIIYNDNADVVICGETPTLLSEDEWRRTDHISSTILEKFEKPRTSAIDGMSKYYPRREDPPPSLYTETFSDGR